MTLRLALITLAVVVLVAAVMVLLWSTSGASRL